MQGSALAIIQSPDHGTPWHLQSVMCAGKICVQVEISQVERVALFVSAILWLCLER